MVNISERIYSKIKSTMDLWSDDDIYAISFFCLFKRGISV